MDGSQKLPQRMLGTLGDARMPCPGLSLAVAGWMRYVGGLDQNGAVIDVRDPLAEQLERLSRDAGSSEEKVAALLSVREIFSAQIAERIAAPVTAAYEMLVAKGAKGAVQEVLK
jgi:fructuronate reductase